MFYQVNFSRKKEKKKINEIYDLCSFFFFFNVFSRRCSLVPNREKLKTFIRSYAFRLGNRSDSPWIFYDDINKTKYEIKDCLSLEIIEKFKKSMTITLPVNLVLFFLFLFLKCSNYCLFYRKFFANKKELHVNKLKNKRHFSNRKINQLKLIIIVSKKEKQDF